MNLKILHKCQNCGTLKMRTIRGPRTGMSREALMCECGSMMAVACESDHIGSHTPQRQERDQYF